MSQIGWTCGFRRRRIPALGRELPCRKTVSDKAGYRSAYSAVRKSEFTRKILGC